MYLFNHCQQMRVFMQSTVSLETIFIYSFIHWFIHSFVNSLFHSLFCSFIHLFRFEKNKLFETDTCFIHSFIHSFLHSFICSFIQVQSIWQWACCSMCNNFVIPFSAFLPFMPMSCSRAVSGCVNNMRLCTILLHYYYFIVSIHFQASHWMSQS